MDIGQMEQMYERREAADAAWWDSETHRLREDMEETLRFVDACSDKWTRHFTVVSHCLFEPRRQVAHLLDVPQAHEDIKRIIEWLSEINQTHMEIAARDMELLEFHLERDEKRQQYIEQKEG